MRRLARALCLALALSAPVTGALADPVAELRAERAQALATPLPAPVETAILVALDPGFRDRDAAGSPITRYLARSLGHVTGSGQARLRAEEDLVRDIAAGLSHDEILGAWAAEAYFGRGCFGVAPAAQALLGVPMDEIDQGDALTLMALLPAPAALLRDPAALRARYAELVEGGTWAGRISNRDRISLLSRGPTPPEQSGRCTR